MLKIKTINPYSAESEWATLEVTFPHKNRIINRPFLNILQNHPNLFPIQQRFIL